MTSVSFACVVSRRLHAARSLVATGWEEKLSMFYQNVVIRTELVRKNTIFCASNWYCKGVWRDWVEIDWGEEGLLPCKIWGFIDLTALDPELGVNYGSCDLTPGCFAIVECGAYYEDNKCLHKVEQFCCSNVDNMCSKFRHFIGLLLDTIMANHLKLCTCGAHRLDNNA